MIQDDSMRWKNWSGRQEAALKSLVFVRSEEDARALIRQCAGTGKTIRAAGAGHSHSPLVNSDSIIIDSSGLAGILEVDILNQEAWVRSGSSIYSLGANLCEHGLALKNQGDIDRQFLAGAISTGTHGTGRKRQNLSAAVTGLFIVLASGEEIECSRFVNPDLFDVTRLGIGSSGFITRVKMKLQAREVLKEESYVLAFQEVNERISELELENDRFEFFWYPGSDNVNIKTINPVASEPEYPLAKEGSRVGWSHEVLPSHRPHLHTEMEYSVPAENGPKCFEEIRNLLRKRFPEVKWPVEYRTVAADEIWLSMAYARDVVTISVHQDIRENEEPYFRACEEVFLLFDGRPHWGKLNYLSREGLAKIYPRWNDWWHIRDKYDPEGMFLNEYTKGLQPR